MMANNRYAQKEAFAMVKETCPHVDAALSAAADAVKAQTGALRDALVEAIARALDAEEKVNNLEREVSRLERELEDAREQISA
jgi:predicted  nucleic acid-binding Zn-ribbon protein